MKLKTSVFLATIGIAFVWCAAAPNYDTSPGYVDTQPFPAAPVKLTYKAIYRVGDAQTGKWSSPVSVTVGG